MKKIAWFLCFVFLTGASGSDTQDSADIILYNGKIVTVDENFSIAEAVAIKSDLIQDMGTNSEMLEYSSRRTKMIDLHGKTVLPGLIDAHLHPVSAAESEILEIIPDVHSIKELLNYIQDQTRKVKEGEWIIHPKLFFTRLKELRQPTLEELDGASPKHPVFLNGSYAGMINSCAMRLSGIDKASGHPGILKDADTGEPTGIIQASAFSLLEEMPENRLSYKERLDALVQMLKRYNRVGLTSITDGAQELSGIKMYMDLWTQERLPIRVSINILAPPFESKEQFEEVLRKWGIYTQFGNNMVRIGALKLFLDGGILTGTAYMREPWGPKARKIYGIDDPEYRGILNYTEKQLQDIVSAAHTYGWKMTAHCTGGGAVDILLEAYEKAHRRRSIYPRRFSIIHGNFFTPEAIEKCRRLNVIADCQPAWFYKDADAMKDILGGDRVKNFFV